MLWWWGMSRGLSIWLSELSCVMVSTWQQAEHLHMEMALISKCFPYLTLRRWEWAKVSFNQLQSKVENNPCGLLAGSFNASEAWVWQSEFLLAVCRRPSRVIQENKWFSVLWFVGVVVLCCFVLFCFFRIQSVCSDSCSAVWLLAPGQLFRWTQWVLWWACSWEEKETEKIYPSWCRFCRVLWRKWVIKASAGPEAEIPASRQGWRYSCRQH